MREDESPLLVTFSEDERRRAIESFQSIKAFLEEDVALPELSIRLNIPLRTLRRRVKNYRDNGLVGLIRQKRSKQLRKVVCPELEAFVEGLALRSHGRTASSIWRDAVALCNEQGWVSPSYTTVYRIIRNLDPRLVTFAREGTKVYKEKFDLIHRRECSRPNQIWQADHTMLDIWLLHEKGEARRPWLTVILDDYSRAVCGYYLSFDAPNSLRTALCLRQAIWRKADPRWHVMGIPDIFYTDNGSDFTSKHMEQVSADIKMQLIFSIPGMPRGRGKMERFFGTVNELFLCHLQGYMGGKEQSKPALTLTELSSRFHEWMASEYIVRAHAGINGFPQAKWEENAFLPRTADSLEQLDLLLLTVAKPRRVRPDGIYFECLRYVSVTLAPYVGETVVIRYDPRDMAEIRVFYKNRFLCRAVCSQLESQTVTLQEIVKARNARSRELRSELSDRKSVVSRYIKVHLPEPTPRTHNASIEVPKGGLKSYIND